MSQEILQHYSTIKDWQEDLYQHFHAHPEVSLQEFETANRIETELHQLGLKPQRIGETGVVAVLKNGEGGSVLTRADIDALPVQEATGLPYSSQLDGVMHACGHDAHIASLLGAVRLLIEHKESWTGTYTALFQPAEELAAGAQKMVDDGLTSKIPTPDVAFCQHVIVGKAGTVQTMSGPVLSAGDSIKITLYGRGAHGSMPHTSVDTVVLAASVVLRLQTIVAREVEPGTFAVLTVGANNAGSKSNIIPDTAELLVNIRTYDEAVRQQIIAAIERIVKAECTVAGAPREPEFVYYDQYPLTSNNVEVNEKVTAAFAEQFGECLLPGVPATASEDFSTIPDALGIPYTYWFVGSSDAEVWTAAHERGTVAQDIPANHNPGFAPVLQPTLEVATVAQLTAALAYLGT